MNRAEFERWFAQQRGKTITELRAAGYLSAPCPDDEDSGGCGWQAIAIPDDAGPLERSTILRGLVASSVKKFGEA
jgi:hypothetical protein